ncbi:hypothetical protein L1987_79321 [Smallanthus sonchifolius]|uniref:Uncharacterized protein n=1 Tax=Smallanthus sonchifolius TaxID=185202 RepID=A0ACB8ZG71_9ASTR|nr:hypothetical protein L1987_79321 [Smallanthus sonchifolius]
MMSEEVAAKYMVGGAVAIHSQVRKIKQELEKTMHLGPEHPETRPVLPKFFKQAEHSHSPLGVTNENCSHCFRCKDFNIRFVLASLTPYNNEKPIKISKKITLKKIKE